LPERRCMAGGRGERAGDRSSRCAALHAGPR
jgi:hypothetical protein